MSFQAVAWAIEVRVGDPILKNLLMAICHHADRVTWSCWPSQDLLAYETEVSKRTIQRKMEELEEKGFIRIEKRRNLDGTRANSIITVTSGHAVTLQPPVDKNAPTSGQNRGVPVDSTCPPIKKQEEQEEQSLLAPLDIADRPKAKSKNGTRIPADFKLTAERGNYGRSRGLHRREVEQEFEKFTNFWTARAGAAGVKLDWDATWRNWCISTAQRLGRTPPPEPGAPAAVVEIDRSTWENLSRIYESTSNWRPDWGPEPGETGCRMPPDLQAKFVNSGLTRH